MISLKSLPLYPVVNECKVYINFDLMKRIFILLVLLLGAFVRVLGQEVDLSNNSIVNSDEYYWGVGYGTTYQQAKDAAMGDIIRMIAINVSSEFTSIGEQESRDGEVSHNQRVENIIRTYAQTTLNDVESWILREESDNYAVMCYMKRSELYRIYEGRIQKAKDLAVRAEQSLSVGRLDMALQYYYASYSLIRSVQRPNEVVDENGRQLINEIPVRIREILQGVTVSFEKKEDDVFVDLLFFYNGKPVSSLDFNYNDGRAFCPSRVKDGRGSIELVDDFVGEYYHINIEYEYKGQWRGDAEMESVLKQISKKTFKDAHHKIKGDIGALSQRDTEIGSTSSKKKQTASQYSFAQMQSAAQMELKPSESQLVNEDQIYQQALDKVLSAIKKKSFLDIMDCFTAEGLDVYNRLIAYGTGRVVGEPKVYFFKGTQGKVAARGVQMSFTFPFGRGGKQTYVEDVIFYFNQDALIENVAFGLGEESSNDIISRKGSGWDDATKEMLMEFLENYKTAYCLKRLDYITTIFSDDAVIIVGNVAKAKPTSTADVEKQLTIKGQQIVTYNRYTKSEYIDNLEKVFNRNAFVNIKFTHNEIQSLEKFENQKVYGIRIGQEYNSSTYADMGYLYLIVDMTNKEEPLIKVRTWEPNEVDLEDLYGVGDFF